MVYRLLRGDAYMPPSLAGDCSVTSTKLNCQ
jgi:hypothetical protein